MNYNLTGEIHNATGLTIDDTLTVRNHAADAKATGEAINAVKTSLNGHADDKANPHGVTKAQVGLGDVDNTADIEKPVSKAQAAAIAEAKKAGTDAQANLDLALLEIGKEDGKALSTNDFTDGYKAKLDGIEAGANKYELADGAVTGNKIASGAVSRTKLANDALYSPVVTISSDRSIAASDLGATLLLNGSGTLTVTFDASSLSALPTGATIALCRWMSGDCVLRFSGNMVVVTDVDGFIKSASQSEVKLTAPIYNTFAVKKMTSSGILVTGNVEVV